MLKQPFISGAGQYSSDEKRTDFRGVTFSASRPDFVHRLPLLPVLIWLFDTIN